ncbi:hypothetical protein AB1L88_01310 [Tautonia sp. JC769]|uniref:TPR end-of-group domain-containing protein n=1 Tax=Tautonia sp. JC769 TaxID=3232135 RepID=UPI003458CAC0
MTMRRDPRRRGQTLLLLAAMLPPSLSCREPSPDPQAARNPPDAAGGADTLRPPPAIDPEAPLPPPPDPVTPDEGGPGPLTLDQIDLEGLPADELFALVPRLDSLDDQRAVLEAVIRRWPDHHQALVMLMEVTQSLGVNLAIQEGRRAESFPYLNRSAEVARMLMAHDEPLTESQQAYVGIVFYNEACNHALEGDSSLAIDSLRQALELGFRDPILWDDPELDSLRDRDDFRQLLDQYRGQVAAPEADAEARPLPEDN